MSALVGFSHKGQERQEQDFGKEEPSAANNSFCNFLKKVCHRLSLGAYIHLVKLVARTEASSSALRFRVSRRCFFLRL